MKTSTIYLCAAASIMALAIGATPASASEKGPWSVSAAVGSTSVDTTNIGNLSPEGTVLDVVAYGNIYDNGDLNVSFVAGGTLGQVEASNYGLICSAADCGEDTYERSIEKVDGSVRFGVQISHDVGPFKASVGAGMMASRYSRTYHYTYDVSASWTWSESEYAVGSYVDVGLSYPLTDDMVLVGRYSTSDQTVGEGNGWRRSIEATTWTVGAGWEF